MPTYCEDCDLVHNPKDPAWKWLCIKFKREEPDQYVSYSERLIEPYHKCKDINRNGNCKHFEPRKELNNEHE